MGALLVERRSESSSMGANRYADVILGSYGHVAYVVRVSAKTVENWGKAGMPGRPRQYSLREVLAWSNARDAERNKSKAPAAVEAIEFEHAQVRLDRDKLKLDKERGTLVERSVVESEFVGRMLELEKEPTRCRERHSPGNRARSRSETRKRW